MRLIYDGVRMSRHVLQVGICSIHHSEPDAGGREGWLRAVSCPEAAPTTLVLAALIALQQRLSVGPAVTCSSSLMVITWALDHRGCLCCQL